MARQRKTIFKLRHFYTAHDGMLMHEIYDAHARFLITVTLTLKSFVQLVVLVSIRCCCFFSFLGLTSFAVEAAPHPPLSSWVMNGACSRYTWRSVA